MFRSVGKTVLPPEHEQREHIDLDRIVVLRYEQHSAQFSNGKYQVSFRPMVLVLVGSSVHDAHIWSEPGPF